MHTVKDTMKYKIFQMDSYGLLSVTPLLVYVVLWYNISASLKTANDTVHRDTQPFVKLHCNVHL